MILGYKAKRMKLTICYPNVVTMHRCVARPLLQRHR